MVSIEVGEAVHRVGVQRHRRAGMAGGGCVGASHHPILVLSLVVLLLASQGVFGLTTCDPRAMAVCLRPLDVLTRQHTTILPSYTDRTLRDVCKLFRQMEGCLAPLRPTCSQPEAQVYTGVEKASTFLCGDGLRQYRNHSVCFAKDALAVEGSSCNITHNTEQAGKNTTPSKLCKEADRFTACVRDAVLRHCGGGAALWVENVNTNVFLPLLQNVGCYKEPTNVRIAIIFGLTVTLFILILITVVASLVCRRNRLNTNRISLRLLATSVEEQEGLGKEEQATIGCPCSRTNVYNRLPLMTRTKMTHCQTHQNQDGRHGGADVIINMNGCGSTFGEEENCDEIEEELDQSVIPISLSGERSCLAHTEMESLLPLGGTLWKYEELHSCILMEDGGHLPEVLEPLVGTPRKEA